MSTLHLLCGLPRAGKTTLAEWLALFEPPDEAELARNSTGRA